MTLKRSQLKLNSLPNSEQLRERLEQEYEALVHKINEFYEARKLLIATKREKLVADVEKSELMQQYKELKQKLAEQQRSWQLLTAELV